jgi:predicted acyl esterase
VKRDVMIPMRDGVKLHTVISYDGFLPLMALVNPTRRSRWPSR